MWFFRDKVILIIAADSAIGEATAEYFAKQRALLVLVGQNEKKLKNLIEKLWHHGIECAPLTILANIITDSDRIIDETIAKFGHLDVLINTFGIGFPGSIEKMEMNEFDMIMATNMRAVTLLTKKAIKYLNVTRGNIINVSSICGITPFPNYLAYSISKAALNQFTKCVAMELESKRIRINAICPGFNITEFLPGDMESAHEIMRLEKCVKAIAFLARDQEPFLSGKILSGAIVPLPVTNGRSVQCIDII
ncbi:uncharacterized protein LOC116343053 [Contarinia nasturtii]|uniref:uncharacterized protein LOC116343053 n=1 Tax=Contarinia nasturtii TaxID=265458 RepID=UPI0012D3E81A|nr:uncharacterized protein LOC116343053 [Contarinia nasturtii]